jgi:hypothetical protein
VGSALAGVALVVAASGCVTDLGVPEGFDQAAAGAVAPNGLIAGYAQHVTDQFPFFVGSEAFLLDDGEYTMIRPGATSFVHLGALEGGTSSAAAIAGDRIVGSVDIDGRSHVATFTATPP